MAADSSQPTRFTILCYLGLFIVILVAAAMLGLPASTRHQARQDETNIIAINEFKIQQTEQLVQVEKQKAQIRIVEAEGISHAQHIINATLTGRYLQHEAIAAQEKMANSPNTPPSTSPPATTASPSSRPSTNPPQNPDAHIPPPARAEEK